MNTSKQILQAIDLRSVKTRRLPLLLISLMAIYGLLFFGSSESITADSNGRVTSGLIALYAFDQGADANTVYDVSGYGSALDLTFSGGDISWLGDGGLAINGPSTIVSTGPAGKIIEAAQNSDSVTLEAWINPANITQDGPARIASISDSATTRNITLGQGLWGKKPKTVYDVRLRTAQSDDNGIPSLTSSEGTAQARLQHLVMTYSSGQWTIFVDNVPAATDTQTGNLDNWDSTYPLFLANEADDSRPWLGELHLVAFYDRALSAGEVAQNYEAGPRTGSSPTQTPTITPDSPTATSVSGGGTLDTYVSFSSGGSVGGVTFADEDILKYDTAAGSWSLFLDGSDVGLSGSTDRDIDAFHILDDGRILFSIIGETSLPDIGSVDDSDIILFEPTSMGPNSAGSFSLYFDGSDVGLSTDGEDIDSLTVLGNGDLLISLAGIWSVGGHSGEDEDMLQFSTTSLGSTTSGTWTYYFDGSDLGLDETSEDIWGVHADNPGGDLYFTVKDAYSANNVSGEGADVLKCVPTSLGSNTTCSLELAWDGSANGIAGEYTDGLAFHGATGSSPTSTSTPDPGPTNTPTATYTPLPATTTPDQGTLTQEIFLSSSTGGTVGGVAFSDEDILEYDIASSTWSMFLDGSDVGLSGSGASDIDAFHLNEDGSVLFSITAATSLPDVGSVDDSDIIRFVPASLGKNTSGTFSLYFDGSDVELTTDGEDIDSLAILDNGDLLLSLSGGWSTGGLSGVDEDLVQFSPTNLGSNTEGSWSLFFDGSDVGLDDTAGEDTWGAWVDNASGALYLTPKGAFSVNGASGKSVDILRCQPKSLGNDTDCLFGIFWNGLVHGISGEYLDGLSLRGVDDGSTTPVPTNTPQPPTATPTPGSGGGKTEMLVYEWDGLVTQQQKGFPRHSPPTENGDWTKPVNFAHGTFYMRVQIRSQPKAQDMRLQYCVWQDKNALETCTKLADVKGTSGTVVTWSHAIDKMWKKSDKPIDWTRARFKDGVAIKNSDGKPVSPFQNWNWNGEDPAKWYPINWNFQVVVVAKGETFSGWQNYK